MKKILFLSLISLVLIGSNCFANETIKHITTQEQFKTEIIEASKTQPVIVDFYATWCPPCKQLTPVFEKVSNQYKEKIKFIKVDIDQGKSIANQKNVQSVPTLIFFKDGKEIFRTSGFKTAVSIKNLITKHFKIK